MRASILLLTTLWLGFGTAVPAVVGEETSIQLKKKQALVKGLLLRELGPSNFAAQASQINATAIPGGESSPSTLKFNQEVGPDMTKALGEVRNQSFRSATEQQKAFVRIMDKAQAADALFDKLRADKALMEELEGK